MSPFTTALKPICAAVLFALALAGCSKGGLSTSVENSTSAETGSKTDITGTKTLSAGRTAKASTMVPGAQLIAETLYPVLALEALDIDAFAWNTKYMNEPILDVNRALAKHGFTGADTSPVSTSRQVTLAKQRLASLADQMGRDVALDYAASQLSVCLEHVTGGDAAQGRTCLTAYYTHIYAGAAILAASRPQEHPGFTRETVHGYSNERVFPAKEMQAWLGGVGAILEMSLNLQPVLLAGITGQVLRSPDAARAHIIKALFDLPVEQIQALAVRPKNLTARVYRGELDSPLKVAVPELGWTIVEDEKGLTLIKNGSPYHGDGMLAGGKMEIAFETTAGANLDRKTSIGSDTSTKSSGSIKTSADVK